MGRLWLQINSLRILFGLCGCQPPLDLVQPCRLEMKTKPGSPRGDNLYQFRGESITDALNKELKKQQEPVLVNLAFNKYFKSVKPIERLLGRNSQPPSSSLPWACPPATGYAAARGTAVIAVRSDPCGLCPARHVASCAAVMSGCVQWFWSSACSCFRMRRIADSSK